MALVNKKIREYQDEIGTEKALREISFGTTEHVVGYQKLLVKYIIFDVLKHAQAQGLWNSLEKEATQFSDEELIVYWDAAIKKGIKFVNKM